MAHAAQPPLEPIVEHHTTSAPINAFTPPPVLTPREFYQATKGVIGLNSIYELLRAQRIRHVKIGPRFLILASETTAFFDREASNGLDA